MNRSIHPQQMEAWIAKMQSNMRTFLETDLPGREAQLNFIRQQYVYLDTTVKVLNGKTYFVGCPHPKN